ncbi:MAG TPA: acetolactate synthase small subunit [Oligoflexia bacterium]|nr:acetolactate synthase small subunit [Oligoflexia bacterium]HMP47147.1 acetolactate synthase small subunit [Oligoflexia bacterium]
MDNKHTIIVLTENSPGVLQRVTSVFTRRRVNIESLTVSETEHHERSRFTVTFVASKAAAIKILKPIQRFVEVEGATLCSDDEIIYREIAFFRVVCVSDDERDHLWNLARNNHAEIASMSSESLIIEKTGTEEEINMFRLMLPESSIISFVRSGRIAIEKKIQERIISEVDMVKKIMSRNSVRIGEKVWGLKDAEDTLKQFSV